MESEPIEQVERQLTGFQLCGAPRELRAAVLADVHRELRAAQWDWRLGRGAAVLLLVGVGLNLWVGGSMGSRIVTEPIARTNSQQSLMDAAVTVAEATDAATGRRFARQLAAMAGLELTDAEAAAIDAAVQRAAPHATINGNRG